MKSRNAFAVAIAGGFLLFVSAACFGQEETAVESAPPAPDAAAADADAVADAVAASRVKIVLKDGTTLTGAPVEIESIKINSIFGEASVALHTIAGIRFGQTPAEASTLVLINGDALTGDIALPALKIVTDWGEAKIHTTSVVSIARPDLSWSSVGSSNGERWQLKKSVATTPTNTPRFYNRR